MRLREPATCICPHAVKPYGRLYGVSMGSGPVRLSTTAGCLEHDTCHGWTKEKRQEYKVYFGWGGDLYCPIHRTNDCPEVKS